MKSIIFFFLNSVFVFIYFQNRFIYFFGFHFFSDSVIIARLNCIKM